VCELRPLLEVLGERGDLLRRGPLPSLLVKLEVFLELWK
jgi:hypothetical protein